MLLEKRVPSAEELESQMALELPDRQTLALVVIKNVLNGLHVRINVKDVNVAIQVCAVVDLLQTIGVNGLQCRIFQK
jgi:hypothetical protein